MVWSYLLFTTPWRLAYLSCSRFVQDPRSWLHPAWCKFYDGTRQIDRKQIQHWRFQRFHHFFNNFSQDIGILASAIARRCSMYSLWCSTDDQGLEPKAVFFVRKDHGNQGLVIFFTKQMVMHWLFGPRPSCEAFLEMEQKFNWWTMGILDDFFGPLNQFPLNSWRLQKKTELYIVIPWLYPLMPIKSN